MIVNSGEMGSIEMFWIAEGENCSVLRVITELVVMDISNCVLVTSITC